MGRFGVRSGKVISATLLRKHASLERVALAWIAATVWLGACGQEPSEDSLDLPRTRVELNADAEPGSVPDPVRELGAGRVVRPTALAAREVQVKVKRPGEESWQPHAVTDLFGQFDLASAFNGGVVRAVWANGLARNMPSGGKVVPFESTRGLTWRRTRCRRRSCSTSPWCSRASRGTRPTRT